MSIHKNKDPEDPDTMDPHFRKKLIIISAAIVLVIVVVIVLLIPLSNYI